MPLQRQSNQQLLPRDRRWSEDVSRTMKARYYIGVGVLILIVGLAWTALPSRGDPILQGKVVQEYKTLTCGCCGTYGAYAQKKGMKVEVVNVNDADSIKDKYGVPEALRSCHTVIVDGYFVEGHVPAEAIAKMLAEKPGIKGIAMQGMPYGSPGMPGNKEGPFVVYAVQNDGSYEEYMRI